MAGLSHIILHRFYIYILFQIFVFFLRGYPVSQRLYKGDV